MARKVDLVIKPRLDAVTLRPGDTLVIRVSADYTAEEVDGYKTLLSEKLPGVTPVFIASEQLLVYRPDGGGDG